MPCEHCETVRMRQAQIVAWGGGQWPQKYYSSADSGTRWDGDPGPCPCPCHEPWRVLARARLT